MVGPFLGHRLLVERCHLLGEHHFLHGRCSEDVDGAGLNSRGWVLQERALSRRTLHFSGNQTYWECGQGVYCEDFTRLESLGRRHNFFLDPRFPHRLSQSGNKRIVHLLQFLLVNYSSRFFTQSTDKVVAISGLAARCARTLDCEERFGVFAHFLHRNLLWYQDSWEKLERINYKDQTVPSWSLLAYQGSIAFHSVSFNSLAGCEWNTGLEFDSTRGDALITADIGQFWNCRLEHEGLCCTILTWDGKARGWLQYDMESVKDVHSQRCCVVGRESGYLREGEPMTQYYVLVLKPRGVNKEYERIGWGYVDEENVSRLQISARIV